MHSSIVQHGAIAAEGFLNTVAFQSAIDSVAAAGGGMVLVPPGIWRTGMIHLKDRVRLHLEAGAVIKGADRPEDYGTVPMLVVNRAEMGDISGAGHGRFHLIRAEKCRDIAITGQGRIDGNGSAFYTPSAALSWPRARDEHQRMRSCVEITNCQDVRIEDVTIGNTSNWTLHLHDCDRVRISGIRIDNPATAPNADGIDIGGCRSVVVSDCFIDTCDDAICLKTYPGGRSCEDVTVTNCVIRTHCVALKFGCAETYADFRRVTFSNCVIHGSHRAIGIYSHKGGLVEDVAINNIVADTCAPLMFARPIHIDLRHLDKSRPAGAIRGIHISGVRATTTGRIILNAEPGLQLEDIALHQVSLRYPLVDDPLIKGASVGGAQFSNGNPWVRVERAAVVGENISDLVLADVNVRWPTGPANPEWLFDKKMANGTNELFTPEHWTTPDLPFAAISLKNVLGGRIDTRGLTGWGNAPAVRQIP